MSAGDNSSSTKKIQKIVQKLKKNLKDTDEEFMISSFVKLKRMEAEEELTDLYYNKNVFQGRDKIYERLNSKGIRVSRPAIMRWLKRQELYQVNAAVHKVPKILKSTLPIRPFYEFGIDLTDLGDLQGGKTTKPRYIYNCIDLFTKKIYAETLVRKDEDSAVKAFKRILKKIKKDIGKRNISIKFIRSDRGSEFINKKMKETLQKENIKLKLSAPANPRSNGIIENANDILKKLIYRRVQKCGSTLEAARRWSEFLQDAVAIHNSSVSSSHNMTPDKVTKATASEITEIRKYMKQRMDKRIGNIKGKIKKGTYVKIKRQKKEKVYQVERATEKGFFVNKKWRNKEDLIHMEGLLKNDYVRIQNRALGQERFTTKKDEEKTWGRTKYTKEIYQIIRVVTSQLFKNQYVLKDIETGQVATHPSGQKRMYYEFELQFIGRGNRPVVENYIQSAPIFNLRKVVRPIAPDQQTKMSTRKYYVEWTGYSGLFEQRRQDINIDMDSWDKQNKYKWKQTKNGLKLYKSGRIVKR